MSDLITISMKEYYKLIRDQEQLNALEAGGVDNWEWYSESLQGWYKKYYPDELDEEDDD